MVLGSAEPKPVKWREWANKQESENPGYFQWLLMLIIVLQIFLNIDQDF
jgi:hypothetical protein